MYDHWFEGLADHMGEAYLNYSFTKGTEQEVDYLVSALTLLESGMKLLMLDVALDAMPTILLNLELKFMGLTSVKHLLILQMNERLEEQRLNG